MYQKSNRFYADWRNRKGVRLRKAFATAEEAIEYEERQKAAARPKQQGAGRPSQKSSAPISSRTPSPAKVRSGSRRPSTTSSKPLSELPVKRGRATSPATTSAKPPRATITSPRPRGIRGQVSSAASVDISTRSTVRPISATQSRVSPRQHLGTSPRQQRSGNASSKPRHRSSGAGCSSARTSPSGRGRRSR